MGRAKSRTSVSIAKVPTERLGIGALVLESNAQRLASRENGIKEAEVSLTVLWHDRIDGVAALASLLAGYLKGYVQIGEAWIRQEAYDRIRIGTARNCPEAPCWPGRIASVGSQVFQDVWLACTTFR